MYWEYEIVGYVRFANARVSYNTFLLSSLLLLRRHLEYDFELGLLRFKHNGEIPCIFVPEYLDTFCKKQKLQIACGLPR